MQYCLNCHLNAIDTYACNHGFTHPYYFLLFCMDIKHPFIVQYIIYGYVILMIAQGKHLL